MQQDPILIQLLEDAGLPPKEAAVYLALLDIGSGTVREIAKLTELKRPIIYVLIESLMKRGYATQIPNKAVHTFQPTDPSLIGSKLNSSAKNFADMLPVLQTMANRQTHRPRISYFDSKDAIWNAYNEVNHYKRAYFITSPSRIERVFPGSLASWETSYRTKRNKLISKNIIPNNEEDKKIIRHFGTITDKVEGRVYEGFQDHGIDIALYDTKLSIASFSEKPFLVLIESDNLVETLTPFFEGIWTKAKSLL